MQGLSGKAENAMDNKPAWARRITEEREARGWNKPQLIVALRAHAPSELPGKGVAAAPGARLFGETATPSTSRRRNFSQAILKSSISTEEFI